MFLHFPTSPKTHENAPYKPVFSILFCRNSFVIFVFSLLGFHLICHFLIAFLRENPFSEIALLPHFSLTSLSLISILIAFLCPVFSFLSRKWTNPDELLQDRSLKQLAKLLIELRENILKVFLIIFVLIDIYSIL